MVKIAPSILSADFAQLGRDIRRVSSADLLHVDVMDGSFVPNISLGSPVLRSIRRATEMFLDVHLMVVEPLRYVERFCDDGADLVTVHLEADTPDHTHASIRKIRDRGKKAGIALKPATPAEAALPFLDEVDLVLAMTVEPGFGGQSFMAEMLPKISSLREAIGGRAIDLEVDGGISPETCGSCIQAGANVLVAGSAIYGAEDIPARIEELRRG